MTWRCPECGSHEVEELTLVWINPNTVEFEIDQRATLYDDLYWCANCGSHVDELEEHDDG